MVFILYLVISVIPVYSVKKFAAVSSPREFWQLEPFAVPAAEIRADSIEDSAVLPNFVSRDRKSQLQLP